MKIRAVAWDVDGTLVDSEPLHHRALVEASKGFGVDLTDLPDQAFRGVHMKDVWLELRQRMPKALNEGAWLAAINAFYIRHRHELKEEPNVMRTIKTLSDNGIFQVCVSNSAREIVAANLEALGILDFMSLTISLDDVTQGKPSPEPYAKACSQLRLSPKEVLAVEDSQTGVASAQAAGLRVAFYANRITTPRPDVALVQNIQSVLSLVL